MTENEDQTEDMVSERDPTINAVITSTTISELPGKSYGITVEVPLFLIMLAMTIASTPVSNIIMFRTCVHSLNHSNSECNIFLSPDKTNTSKNLEVEVQEYVIYISTVKIIIESLVPAFLSFFLGAWSDTHGRKPLVVWPLLGITLSSMMIVVYSMLSNLGPWWFILTAIPYSLTGGFTVIFTGAFCYMSDVTTSKNRSLRMTILEAGVSVGTVLGSVLSSHLLRMVGNVYLLLISAALNVAAYSFSVVYIRESLTGAIKGGFTSVLDILLVKEMFRECFKRRPNNGREQILLLTVANSLSIFILYGLLALDYLYAREKIHWAMEQFTIFSAAHTTITFIGSLIGVGLIQRFCRVSDLAFSIIAFLSSTAEYLIRAFATLGWHMYLGAGVALFKGLSSPLIRSLLTKILPVEDIAKVFSLMCALEGISPLLSPAIFNALYGATIDVYPGAIYVLSASITGVCVVMLGFVQYYICRGSSYARLEQ